MSFVADEKKSQTHEDFSFTDPVSAAVRSSGASDEAVAETLLEVALPEKLTRFIILNSYDTQVISHAT